MHNHVDSGQCENHKFFGNNFVYVFEREGAKLTTLKLIERKRNWLRTEAEESTWSFEFCVLGGTQKSAQRSVRVNTSVRCGGQKGKGKQKRRRQLARHTSWTHGKGNTEEGTDRTRQVAQTTTERGASKLKTNQFWEWNNSH